MLEQSKESLYKVGKFSEFGEQYPELTKPKLVKVIIETGPHHNARLALIQYENKMYWVNVSGNVSMTNEMLTYFAKKIVAPLSYDVIEAWRGKYALQTNPSVSSMLFDMVVTNEYQDIVIPLVFKEKKVRMLNRIISKLFLWSCRNPS